MSGDVTHDIADGFKNESTEIRAYTIHICNDCFNLEGEMCHNPVCIFCRRTMEEVAEYLNVLLIRPVIDGERITVDRGRKVNQ